MIRLIRNTRTISFKASPRILNKRKITYGIDKITSRINDNIKTATNVKEGLEMLNTRVDKINEGIENLTTDIKKGVDSALNLSIDKSLDTMLSTLIMLENKSRERYFMGPVEIDVGLNIGPMTINIKRVVKGQLE